MKDHKPNPAKWGTGDLNNDIGWGQGADNNDIGWGSVYARPKRKPRKNDADNE